MHYLKTEFLREVKETEGLNENSKICEIENLEIVKHGVIRSKGASIVCPRDKKVGAAYSDCLIGDDNVGPATFLFSYTWKYTIRDIIDTLVAFCESNKAMDQKRTYVWICCLCNNQHRVYEDKQNGSNVQVDEFHEISRTHILSIGHVVAMMFPWDDPQYLKRVWCVFEAYTASTEPGCTLTIAMPPKERQAMMSATGDLNNIFEVLAVTMIQNAKAYALEDREKILKLVEDTVGYAKFNYSVNELIRRWVMDTLVSEFEIMNGSKGMKNNLDGDNQDDLQDEKLFRLCYNVGIVMYENGEYDKALVYFKKVLKEMLSNPTVDHKSFSADVYHNIGVVFKAKGDYDNAFVELRKALEIRLKVLGPDHPDTASSYNNIGAVYDEKGDYENALVELRKCLEIELKVLGPDNADTASSYNHIGVVYHSKGDYDNALVEFRKCLEIKLKVLGPDHPDTASSYNHIGVVYKAKGDYENALVEFRKCLEIRLKVLGPDHPDTALSYNDIGAMYDEKGDYENALVEFRKCLETNIKRALSMI